LFIHTTFRTVFNIDGLVKSQKCPSIAIPVNPGSGPGQAPESRDFSALRQHWTPVFTGVTTFYESINIDGTIDVLNRRLLQPVKWSIGLEKDS